jgi:hypothetical protein
MYTREQLQGLAGAAVKSGDWMLRRSNGGKSYNNTFQWADLGEWTEASDWQPTKQCGNGLHGCMQKFTGYYMTGKDLDFCEIDPAHVVDIDGDKVKVRRARVLLRNALPDNLSVSGSLYLSGCTGLTALPDNLSVSGSLYLSGCTGLKIPKRFASKVIR